MYPCFQNANFDFLQRNAALHQPNSPKESSTMHYHAHHASFELPAMLKDKSMLMFMLNDTGPSEFSVVVSHADVQADETVQDFSARLLTDLGKSLPRFQLSASAPRTLDGAAAMELRYNWRRDGIFMHQRQVITLVQGATPDSAQAMLIAATCLQEFSDAWNTAFDDMLDSVKLRQPLAAVAGADSTPAAKGLPTVFALSERRRTLHAFLDREDACRRTDAREVAQDAWAFFDSAGLPLHPTFLIPNGDAGTPWPKAGTYHLDTHADPARPALRDLLHLAAVFVTSTPAVPFSSMPEVHAHFAQED